MKLQCAAHTLDLSTPKIMGILNITPDSFSDGGNYFQDGHASLDLVLKRAEQMLEEGADILDVGGESTRPGAATVSEQEELERVIPVVQALVERLGALVSVDTSTASVIRESAQMGAGIINDVRALTRDGALSAAAKTGLPICLMHMQGQPQTMQNAPSYQDVVAEVSGFLQERIAACSAAGITKERILVDPGFGFGKTLAHNLALLARLPELAVLGAPILVGLSRKSLLGQLLNRGVDERLPGSLALALAAVERGAAIIRVHDVAATKDVLRVYQEIKNSA
ncbi:dihydropteroate synthase [Cellvibrio zantedeschiae]|uniref:Dihydropteroate synthase n=1 Tax=Cellvibrio zantedeschiae TaxID=1237077 RepID=A0ABQ3B264_9GAMM|nr:dihydropteroate synthase [Cellvibrio zantedeschiae]GGY74183.1 dihydropteroate synthase [Cellvibrio zantedeschiae]